MKSVRKSLLLSFAENYTALAIGIVGTLIIARLLTPAEIGIFSVGAVLVGVAHVVRDFGVGQYLIQEKELTKDKIRAAFALTLTIAWSMAIVLFLISAPVAQYYGTPGVRWVVIVLAANFVLIPFGSITMSFLRRNMDFATLYKINTTSNIANSITAVALAYWGFSYMSLAWAATAGNVATFAMTAWYRPAQVPWLPSFKEIRSVLAFGSYASGTSVMGEIGVAAPDMVIGKVLNMDAVAIFGKAAGLLLLFDRLIANTLHTVSLPFFSAQARANEELKSNYLKSISYTTALSWPFFIFIGVMAFPVVRTLYGAQWDGAVPLVQILAVSAAIQSIFFLAGQLYVALGQVKTQTQLQFMIQAVKIGSIVVAAPFGLKAIGVAMVLSTLLAALSHFLYLRHLIQLHFSDILIATRKSFGVALLSAAVPLAVFFYFGNTSEQLWTQLMIAGAGAAAGWIAGIFVFRHEMHEDLTNICIKAWKMIPAGYVK